MTKDLFGVCPYTTAQKILSGKWTLLILYHLSTRTMRFGELQRALPDMTQATLSRQLREMERNGLIVRTAYNQIPPKVEYSLNRLGKQFLPVLSALEVWGKQCISYLGEQAAENKE
jgi:DNA-binding HxlR family transcriptional regulator